MRWVFVSFGKIRTPGIRESADYFLTGVRRYVSIEEMELKPHAVLANAREKDTQTLLQYLARRKEKVSRHAVWVLDETGSNFSTEKWAEQVQTLADSGTQELVLITGAAYGFDPILLKSGGIKFISLAFEQCDFRNRKTASVKGLRLCGSLE